MILQYRNHRWIFIVQASLVIVTFLFFFNSSATPQIYTLSLHDALPISFSANQCSTGANYFFGLRTLNLTALPTAGSYTDRKSTRLNSSHGYISYAVFCLKKKN